MSDENKSQGSAQIQNLRVAKEIANAVRSTLGPKGMDKMLVNKLGDVTITNDGVTILKEMEVNHPVAKMIVEVAKSQDQECGDGTTSVVILTAELLSLAEFLISQKIHPTVICEGYRIGCEKALEIIDKISIHAGDDETLKKVAKVAMIGKLGEHDKAKMADICLRAVSAVKDKVDEKTKVNLGNIKRVQKAGGKIDETSLVEGIIIDKCRAHVSMPEQIDNANIVLFDTAFELKQTEVKANIQITDPASMKVFLEQEKSMLVEMVNKISEAGVNFVACQKNISSPVLQLLADKGIYAIRNILKGDMDKLSRATGARVVMDIESLRASDIGHAGKVQEVNIGGDDWTFITGCKKLKALTILIRGGTEHIVEEMDRIFNDALNVVAVAMEDEEILPGGGAPAMEIEGKLTEFAPKVGGRPQMAVEAFAKAMECIPRTLSDNAGIDGIDMLMKLRNLHADGRVNDGVDVYHSTTANMVELGIIEPFRVFKQILVGATETAIMILRIDDVILSKDDDKDE